MQIVVTHTNRFPLFFLISHVNSYFPIFHFTNESLEPLSCSAYQRLRKVNLNLCPISFMPQPFILCGTNHTVVHTAPSHLTVNKLKEEQLKKNKIGNKVQHDGLCIYMSVLLIESGHAIQVLLSYRKVFNKSPSCYCILSALTFYHWHFAIHQQKPRLLSLLSFRTVPVLNKNIKLQAFVVSHLREELMLCM